MCTVAMEINEVFGLLSGVNDWVVTGRREGSVRDGESDVLVARS